MARSGSSKIPGLQSLTASRGRTGGKHWHSGVAPVPGLPNTRLPHARDRPSTLPDLPHENHPEGMGWSHLHGGPFGMFWRNSFQDHQNSHHFHLHRILTTLKVLAPCFHKPLKGRELALPSDAVYQSLLLPAPCGRSHMPPAPRSC